MLNSDYKDIMVGVAQLVEPWIVIPVVVGSSPIIHPSLVFTLFVITFLVTPDKPIMGSRSLIILVSYRGYVSQLCIALISCLCKQC